MAILPWTLYTVYCTMYNVQCTMYNFQYTLYNVQCTLYSLHFTLYSVYCTLYTVYGIMYTVHFTLYRPGPHNHVFLCFVPIFSSTGVISPNPDLQREKKKNTLVRSFFKEFCLFTVIPNRFQTNTRKPTSSYI